MRTTLIALSALALGITATSVSAKDFVVEHADLDLSDKRDQKTLKSRIKAAAREYCGASISTGTRLNTSSAKCVAEAQKLANEQMAALIEQHSAKGG